MSIELREATFEDEGPFGRSLLRRDSHPTDTVYWVAETATKELVASAGLEFGNEAALLHSVATAEIQRGAGLGKRMVQKALETARSHRLRHVYLLSTGAGSYFADLGFFESPVEELVNAVPNAPQVLRFAALGWLSTEVAWRIDL